MKIIEYIKKNGQASGNELANFLDLSDRAVRKQLASMLTKGILIKVGKPPKVFYLLKDKSDKKEIAINVKDDIKNDIDRFA